jgi:hypothetical protein
LIGAAAVLAHLGRSAANPTSWLRSRGVPTFRHRGRVCAYVDELDAWRPEDLDTLPTRDPVTGRRRRRPRRPGVDIVRAAFLAGQGKTAGEIAAELGGKFTGPQVRAALCSRGVKALADGNVTAAMIVLLPVRAKRALEDLAEARALGLAECAGGMLQGIVHGSEPVGAPQD